MEVLLRDGTRKTFQVSELLTDPDRVLFVLNSAICEHNAFVLQKVKGKKVSLPDSKTGTIVGIANGQLQLSCGETGGSKYIKLTTQRYNQLFGKPSATTRV